MSDDPIIFDRIGTITVQFDDGPVTLRRPTFKQWRHFSRSLQQIGEEAAAYATQATTALVEAQQALEEAKSKAAKDKAQKAVDEAGAVHIPPMYERTLPWMQDVFAQLGDTPAPEVDDWPAFVAADHSLPAQILTHWRVSPKASGPASTN